MIFCEITYRQKLRLIARAFLAAEIGKEYSFFPEIQTLAEAENYEEAMEAIAQKVCYISDLRDAADDLKTKQQDRLLYRLSEGCTFAANECEERRLAEEAESHAEKTLILTLQYITDHKLIMQ